MMKMLISQNSHTSCDTNLPRLKVENIDPEKSMAKNKCEMPMTLLSPVVTLLLHKILLLLYKIFFSLLTKDLIVLGQETAQYKDDRYNAKETNCSFISSILSKLSKYISIFAVKQSQPPTQPSNQSSTYSKGKNEPNFQGTKKATSKNKSERSFEFGPFLLITKFL